MNINNTIKDVKQVKTLAREVANSEGFKAVKEVVSAPMERKVPTIGRDLVSTTFANASEIRSVDLLQRGYKLGGGNILYKVDNKKDIYKAVQFDAEQVSNITIADTVVRTKSVSTTKRANGTWISIVDLGKGGVAKFDAATSDKAAKKASELQFDGFKFVSDSEKTLKFAKGEETIVISKETGKVVND